MKKYLIIHTRELCYFSGTFFLDKLEERLEAGYDFLADIGACEKNDSDEEISVTRLDLLGDDADFDLLEKFVGYSFDAIIDINSKLPYLILDDGSYFLDTIDAPFYNWILDHPLYHHPGLVHKLKNHHALAIDYEHAEYMKRWYPHLKSVTYYPIPGIKAINEIPFDERRYEILFSGTYLDKDPLEDKILALGEKTAKLIHDVAEEWDHENEIMDEAVMRGLNSLGIADGTDYDSIDLEKLSKMYGVLDYPELMNHLYLADKSARNKSRNHILESIAEAGLPLTIMGDGWELTDLPNYSNVEWIPAMTMSASIEVIANTKVLLDINPLFFRGLHDRVSTGLQNGCIVATNMCEQTAPEHREDQMIFYRESNVEELIDRLRNLYK